MATAAAGGCKQRNTNIPKIDRLAAKGMATRGCPTTCITEMPTNADKVFPATTAQGCAIGLWGKAKTNKALAPNEAISHSSNPPISPRNLAIVSTNIRPRNAPKTDLKRSGQDTWG